MPDDISENETKGSDDPTGLIAERVFLAKKAQMITIPIQIPFIAKIQIEFPDVKPDACLPAPGQVFPFGLDSVKTVQFR